MRARHLHYLLPPASPSLLDIPATVLVLTSRGRHVLAGERDRPHRAALADVLGNEGVLAELLASGRPMTADSFGGVYVFEEV